MSGTAGADLRDVRMAVRLFADGIVFIRMYHGVEHAHRLPYYLALWSGTRLQRDAQRRVEHDIALSGPADAGCFGRLVW